MVDQKYSKPLKFSWLMMKFVSVPLYFKGLDGNKKEIKDTFLKMRLTEIDSRELSDFMHSVLPGIEKEVLEEERIIHVREVESSLRKEMEDIFPVLLNQALVMCCTILESFLNDCLRVMMPVPILFLETESDLSRLTDLLDRDGNGDKYDENLENKILRRFDFSGIEDKVKTLKKVGVDFDAAVTFKHKIRPKSVEYALGDAYEFLFGAYHKRHDVVHRGQLPLRCYEDLEAISEFFSELMMNVALIMRDTYNVPMDFDMIRMGSDNINVFDTSQ